MRDVVGGRYGRICDFSSVWLALDPPALCGGLAILVPNDGQTRSKMCYIETTASGCGPRCDATFRRVEGDPAFGSQRRGEVDPEVVRTRVRVQGKDFRCKRARYR